MVSLEELSFAYRKNLVFDNIDIRLSTGSIYGVLGKNGTGKSTLLYLMAGLLKPSKGKAKVLEYTPFNRSPDFLQQIFMIPEEFYLPDISIKNLINYYASFYPKFDRELFYYNMETFGVPDHTLLKMSYGQKKKVLISFGLACNVSLLLMDEPTNGLDITSKSQFRKVMANALNPNRSILISSHQVLDLTNLIDQLIILDHTKVILQKSIQQIEQRLAFKVSNNSYDLDHALYRESSMGGYTVVVPNEGEESGINLELFYKALIHNPEGVQYTLNE
jgi:ABC-2 type transport system ATP-binding protein